MPRGDARRHPDLRIVDITHDIAAFDVRAGALALVRAVQYLPEGSCSRSSIPGVGTDRRCIAVEVENGYLVGPDNGLLAPAVAMLGGPRRIVDARQSAEYQLAAPGPTFAGRDVMAPAAAYLAGGRPDRRARARGRSAAARARRSCRCPNEDDDGTITGEVLWVDRYGNCQLNIAPEQLDAAGAHIGDPLEIRRVTIGGDRPGAGPAGSTHVRRRQAVRARAARRLLRDVHARLRPPVGRGRARSARASVVTLAVDRRSGRRARRSDRPRPQGAARETGTSLILVALLALILSSHSRLMPVRWSTWRSGGAAQVPRSAGAVQLRVRRS